MRLALALIAAAACAAGRESPPLDFERSRIRVGGTPYGLTVADVTEDGRPDLVVSDSENGRLVLLAGTGEGGFERVGEAPAGENPSGSAAADFDGDGHLDLAVANHETRHVTLLAGRGDGTFRPFGTSPLVVGVAPHVHAVGAGDVDGDGRADLLVDDRDGEGIRLLVGRGDGSFGARGTVGTGGDPYRGFVLDDVDGDGALDLVAPIEREVALRPGRGGGSFGELRTLDASPLAPFAVAVGDVDGDGAADLAVGGGEGSAGAAVLRGDGAWGFAPAPGSPYPAGRGAKSVAAGDLDGDGRDEVVVASWNARDLTVLSGGADGTTSLAPESGENPWAPVVADLDGDGLADVAAANYGEGTVTVLLSRPRR